ncbi:PREDICTED: coiled-coil domain-containing protein 142 [Cyprinodon variegatus]|uniref:coiled-coil domain-containing protein 142 n=1 Tax=Cyprinodon variegatus TaxID=28743 RepID=UPI00074261D3|nr:PREDICTED: coiled-coil domain-containing protein 142 [Cyprinodon variegatus]
MRRPIERRNLLCVVTDSQSPNGNWPQTSISGSLFHVSSQDEEEEDLVLDHNHVSRSSEQLLTMVSQRYPVGSLPEQYPALWRLMEQRSLLLFIHEFTRRVRLSAAFISRLIHLLQELPLNQVPSSSPSSRTCLVSLIQEFRLHLTHWTCLYSGVGSDPCLRRALLPQTRMLEEMKRTLDMQASKLLVLMDQYVYGVLSVLGSGESDPVLADLLAGAEQFEQAVEEQLSQSKLCRGLPQPFTASLMKILAVRQAETVATHLELWISEQSRDVSNWVGPVPECSCGVPSITWEQLWQMYRTSSPLQFQKQTFPQVSSLCDKPRPLFSLPPHHHHHQCSQCGLTEPRSSASDPEEPASSQKWTRLAVSGSHHASGPRQQNHQLASARLQGVLFQMQRLIQRALRTWTEPEPTGPRRERLQNRTMQLGRLQDVISHGLLWSVSGLFPEEFRTILEDFSLNLLVQSALAHWDSVVCRGLGSALKDKCLRTESSSCAAEGRTTSQTMRHFLQLLPPLLASLGCFLSICSAPEASGLLLPSCVLQRHTAAALLASLQICTVWVESKAQQFLSSWSPERFLLVSQGDLPMLMDSVEQMMDLTKSFLRSLDSEHHPTARSHHQRLLRNQLDALDGAANELKDFSSLVLENFSTDCKRMSGEIFERTMPPAVHWRPGQRTGLPSSPSENASLAAQAVIGRVLEAPLSEDARVGALSVTMTAFMEAWMEHILRQKIKFSVQGALQLKEDFDSIREMIKSDKYGLSADLVQRLLALR